MIQKDTLNYRVAFMALVVTILALDVVTKAILLLCEIGRHRSVSTRGK